ncbi:MAG: aromatic ring-hydroxylating dioxygenase subunit alpha [bacterium]|nr:aromatic ring-hydroxylating dioxygenase subunit alpha [bacterium]
MARFPFGVPNSWYVVAYSDELAPGQVQRLQYFGRDLVAFRGESGEVAVLDGYCPHLGAHLAVGGEVVGDTLRCPFHAWRWDAEGGCAEIPYAKRIPPNLCVESLPVIERNGMVFAWYHAEGKAPDFEIPEVEGWGQDGWLASWLRWEWTIKTHPQEMAENGIDWPHFDTVHGLPVPEDRSCEFRSNSFLWHVGGAKDVSTLGGQTTELTMHGENWGMGFSWLKQSAIYDTVVATGLTPIDGETTHVRMGVIARIGDQDEPGVRAEIRALMDEHAVFASQDLDIWENKKYRVAPSLCEEDGPIADYRRWASQFY